MDFASYLTTGHDVMRAHKQFWKNVYKKPVYFLHCDYINTKQSYADL